MLEIIAKKRDHGELTADEINDFIEGYTSGRIPDYQASALLMSIYLNGMNFNEASHLAMAMRDSGERLNWPAELGPLIDKHSTGGVGDKISLILAPVVAACGLTDPMIAGRGLGHTGGTLDKLESIPGFRVDLTATELHAALLKSKIVINGATGSLAPADKKLYALRDVTGTVASIPLIASSIMSKKLAAGINGLVMDVKCGQGAFMKQLPAAQELARTLVRIGQNAGVKMTAVITNMDAPLGLAIGNSLEVKEALAVLHGQGPKDIRQLTLALAAHMLVLGNKAKTFKQAYQRAGQTLNDGSAFAAFRQMVTVQGGDTRYVDRPELFPVSQQQVTITAAKSGYLAAIDSYQLGMAVVKMGGGRLIKGTPIKHQVGIVLAKKVSTAIQKGDLLATVHCEGIDDDLLIEIQNAFQITAAPVTAEPLILDTINS
ncbi:thymidine phosphorylase [Agrilactobacillus fermenti]|uniref:thymidine phosphorylase n=1 Tax=Agrilactobacillus fermenti TaxID=2586909 RepID=UPI003A5BF9DE